MMESTRISAETLAAMPAKGGFRQRGMEMNRIETFTDAAFAFAVTLLVVGGGDNIPANLDELLSAMMQVPAFAASFANIMLFWYAHHIWSRRYGLEDAGSVVLSLILIFLVLIYVYPLKAIYSGALDFFSLGFFSSVFQLTSASDLRNLFLIFGVSYLSMSTLIVFLYRHALSKKEQLSLNELEIFDTRTEIQHWVINMLVPVGSIILALVMQGWFIVLAGLFYCLFGVVIPWHAVKRGQQRDKLFKLQPD